MVPNGATHWFQEQPADRYSEARHDFSANDEQSQGAVTVDNTGQDSGWRRVRKIRCSIPFVAPGT
jgi:hypothetical protein